MALNINIEELARQAGWASMVVDNLPGTEDHKRLSAFAQLVAAAVKEAAANRCDEDAQYLRNNGCNHEAAAVECAAEAIRAMEVKT